MSFLGNVADWVEDKIAVLDQWGKDIWETTTDWVEDRIDDYNHLNNAFADTVDAWVEKNIWDTDTDAAVAESWLKQGVSSVAREFSKPVERTLATIDDLLNDDLLFFAGSYDPLSDPVDDWFAEAFDSTNAKTKKAEGIVDDAVARQIQELLGTTEVAARAISEFIGESVSSVKNTIGTPWDWLLERLEDILTIPAQIIITSFRDFFFEVVE